jgi:hypothetical protein
MTEVTGALLKHNITGRLYLGSELSTDGCGQGTVRWEGGDVIGITSQVLLSYTGRDAEIGRHVVIGGYVLELIEHLVEADMWLAKRVSDE